MNKFLNPFPYENLAMEYAKKIVFSAFIPLGGCIKWIYLSYSKSNLYTNWNQHTKIHVNNGTLVYYLISRVCFNSKEQMLSKGMER